MRCPTTISAESRKNLDASDARDYNSCRAPNHGFAHAKMGFLRVDSRMKKFIPSIRIQILRSALYVLLLVGVCGIPFVMAQWSVNDRTTSVRPSIQMQRTLTFADRVAYQRAIEEVYWRHRIWPEENPKPKPSLDEVMSEAQLERKVDEYLSDSQTLESYWNKQLTPDQLQAEMERMARYTRQPEVLLELFNALGNDPAVVAECLARPVLAGRLLGELTTQGKIQQLDAMRRSGRSRSTSGTMVIDSSYRLPEISGGACTDNTWTATSTAGAPSGRRSHTAVWTGSEMIMWGGYDGTDLDTGGKYNPSTDSWTPTSHRPTPPRPGMISPHCGVAVK